MDIMAIICAIASYYMDEITKFSTVYGVRICGRNSMKTCKGDLSECKNALIYGYNLDGIGIDVHQDDGITIVNYEEFKDLCDNGSADACTQLDAGLVFQILNIASAAFGGLGLVVLLIPYTRPATCAFFIFAAVSAVTAFGGFLSVLRCC